MSVISLEKATMTYQMIMLKMPCLKVYRVTAVEKPIEISCFGRVNSRNNVGTTMCRTHLWQERNVSAPAEI